MGWNPEGQPPKVPGSKCQWTFLRGGAQPSQSDASGRGASSIATVAAGVPGCGP
eukprot:CAMPEP_0174317396 /NCGR_PEP_ID=MMETSP0810-20121108/7557_1 /TAXON_ID=73025 ORGANISM="Eutreptiella gymnastica-like, Strain CCMP1594" /NCGR_SAMPLE_ID=MMETSP0810 /ASSEMBLY_ACC=CAM_ASM_000659 /LENGTH=53 /DNA_ID=CAMNT_0015427365 /DNA_START=813 /DNA_END=974 /DNA_ORIENTATION=-